MDSLPPVSALARPLRCRDLDRLVGKDEGRIKKLSWFEEMHAGGRNSVNSIDRPLWKEGITCMIDRSI